ncbi:MAG: glycerophosphodiester phosphodiesterase family protein [Terrimicrobiaceae bacterium]|nr:glycerophosphodiester phosphodiesterase family protein [Terrimicrobiaceae bacterium]
MERPLIIAHRGASRDAPENTPAAFRLAWEQGADATETDLRLTADGRIAAFHDADGRRIFRDPRRIRDLSLSELQKFDAGSWKDPRWRNERVPTLADVVATLPPGRRLVLELKEALGAGFPALLAGAPQDRITLIAFDANVIAEAKRQLPACRALWLFGNYGFIARNRGKWLARRVRELGVDGVDLRHERRLDARLIEPLRADGRTVFTYTVNSRRSVLRCARLGLDGITTDRPADARAWLADVSA